jgi:broad specificity phosphatase PhoE
MVVARKSPTSGYDIQLPTTTMAPPAVTDPMWDDVHPGMTGWVKHRLTLVRHVESRSNRGLMARGVPVRNPNPGITALGGKQIAALRALGLSGVCESSPLDRARHTAGCYDGMIKVREDLREWERSTETEPEFKSRVHALTDEWRARGSTDHREETLVFTHSLFINEVLRTLCGGGAFFHLGNASLTIIDFTVRYGLPYVEVQMVGDVEHLAPELRSGHHTAQHYIARPALS